MLDEDMSSCVDLQHTVLRTLISTWIGFRAVNHYHLSTALSALPVLVSSSALSKSVMS